jgi:hypothetical protein
MAWKPPKEPAPEGDEDDAPKPPVEPNGHDLTEQRDRQAHSRKWTQGVWDEIGKELQDTQRKQQYVPEPKRRNRRADGN